MAPCRSPWWIRSSTTGSRRNAHARPPKAACLLLAFPVFLRCSVLHGEAKLLDRLAAIGDRPGLVAAKIMRRPLHVFDRAVKLSNGGCDSWMLPQLFLPRFLREADLRECKSAENAHS